LLQPQYFLNGGKNDTIFGIALELMHVTANLTGCPEVSFIK